jgi:hypothetical protein
MTRAQSRIVALVNGALFIVVFAAFVGSGIVACYQAVGFSLIVDGVLAVWIREFPVGIQGRPASFHLRGGLAVTIGLLVMCAGAALSFYAQRIACHQLKDNSPLKAQQCSSSTDK